MNNTAYKDCAVCGGWLVFLANDLCGKCFTYYGPRDSFPEWVKELIKIENHNNYVNRQAKQTHSIDEMNGTEKIISRF